VAINMQGPWTVSVTAKNAAFPQRFIVSGAATGNGTYNGVVGTSVYVTGAAWSIQVQNNPGSGFIDSGEQIKFPTVSGGLLRFQIQTNDAGADEDFDDLVLTCTTPQTEADFLLYGSVSHYSANCVFNPCTRRRWWVIDHLRSFELAVQNPHVRKLIEELYPERLIKPPFPPGPDPEPFRPLVLSAEGGIPAKQSLAIRTQDTRVDLDDKEQATVRTVASSRLLDARAATVDASRLSVDRVGVAGLIDRYLNLCETGPLPGVVLRFLEYDRTNAELAGGAYTGTGPRETLGVCATDRNGNYVFRFQRSLAQRFDEADDDTAAGEDALVQSAPDVIVQVLDPMSPGGVRWESAPYWNVPLLKRINICVPEFRPVAACQGQNAIQAIGNIFIGAPVSAPPPGFPVPTARVGFSNTLNAGGRITAGNPLGPITQCAAWTGRLDLFACFLDLPVARYTIRYRRAGDPAWSFYTETYRHPKIASIGVPGYVGHVVGPSTAFTVDPEGEPAAAWPSYTNIENDGAYVYTHRNRKAQISTSLLVPGAGVVQLWIEGYAADGTRLAEDAVTLYVDNVGPALDIPSVEMDDGAGGTQAGGVCALFQLPAGSPGEPLHVRWRATDAEGSLSSYNVSIQRGNGGNIGITGAGAPLSGAYAHGSALSCSLFHGTADQPSADANGYVETDISPSGGSWLPPGVPFCTFAVKVGCGTRVTDGYSAGASYGPAQYLLGIQA
jgi:hypothetical protein